jgi:hypothetical protein
MSLASICSAEEARAVGPAPGHDVERAVDESGHAGEDDRRHLEALIDGQHGRGDEDERRRPVTVE